MEESFHIVLDYVESFFHTLAMPSITKRLAQRYVAEGDELAKDALTAIEELRAALLTMVTLEADPHYSNSRAILRAAKRALAKHK